MMPFSMVFRSASILLFHNCAETLSIRRNTIILNRGSTNLLLSLQKAGITDIRICISSCMHITNITIDNISNNLNIISNIIITIAC